MVEIANCLIFDLDLFNLLLYELLRQVDQCLLIKLAVTACLESSEIKIRCWVLMLESNTSITLGFFGHLMAITLVVSLRTLYVKVF